MDDGTCASSSGSVRATGNGLAWDGRDQLLPTSCWRRATLGLQEVWIVCGRYCSYERVYMSKPLFWRVEGWAEVGGVSDCSSRKSGFMDFAGSGHRVVVAPSIVGDSCWTELP